jgi:hypothetical protein
VSDLDKTGNIADQKKDSISIVYHQRNDSPKYFEIKRSKVYLFFIGLPALTLVAVIIGVIGLLNTSPFHLIENYRQNSQARKEIANIEELKEKAESSTAENAQLKLELQTLQDQVKNNPVSTENVASNPAEVATTATNNAPGSLKCPAPVACPSAVSATVHSIGLSTLSLFKPIQGQKDRTRPAVLNLSGFKTAIGRDTVNLQFNIIPTVTDDSKISGHIVVLMKNELAIQAYPLQTLGGVDFQINYSAGEPFATQRFRPVDASFVKPRKSGNYSFTVFIFSKTGDLIHFQSINAPLKF